MKASKEHKPQQSRVNDNAVKICTKAIQKTPWEVDPDDSTKYVYSDLQHKGFVWYFEKNKLYYTLTPAIVLTVKDLEKRRQLEKYKGIAFSYDEWEKAGWKYKAIEGNTFLGNPNSQKPQDYSGYTSGIEIENPTSHIISLENPNDRGLIAQVLKDNRVIAEITTDMGMNCDYTIELRTTPVSITDDNEVKKRRDAINVIKSVIEKAEDGQITSQKIGDFQINVLVKKHKIKKVKGKRQGVQITKGISFTDMIKEASKTNGFFEEAYGSERWMTNFNKYYKISKLEDENGKVIYAMLASLIHFYLRRIDRALLFETNETKEGIGSKGIIENKLVKRPNLVNPVEKNAWGLLPKTPPGKWLAGLDSQIATNVKSSLNNVPEGLNAVAWKTILQEILNNDDIAGHSVPDFTINNNMAFAFEIRTPSIVDKTFYIG